MSMNEFEGVLSPEEVRQLKEELDFKESDIEDFLKQYFPVEYKREALRRSQAAALESEEPPHPITAEGDGFIEFAFGDRKIRLEREKRTGSGRRRANPYIDTREVNRLGIAGKDACYAMAAYKLRKDGHETATHLDRDITSTVRKLIFRGDEGLVALMHLVRVSEEVSGRYRDFPVPSGLSIDGLVMQAIVSNTTKLLAKHLGDKT